MAIKWYGLVAPEEVPTGDRRMFKAASLGFRSFPLRASWQRVSGQGHSGAVVVGSWEREYAGAGGVWGAGEFLDPRIVPEVTEAIYLLEKRLIGPSVDLDPDLAYEVVPHPGLVDEFAMQVTRATVNGVTFVQGPAFSQVHVIVDSEEEMAILASAGITIAEFSVNSKAWSSWPVAERETPFDADDAIARIAAWSGGDSKRFAQAFLWRDDSGNPDNRETYRLPLADVVNDELVLIPRAVMSAATIMSGAHGGLYDTVPENERGQIQQVLTNIYDRLREDYGDPRFIAPWQRGGRAGATSSEGKPTEASLDPLDFGLSPDDVVQFQSRLGGKLEDYWVHGEGAAKIRWGTEGSFDRCVRALREHFPQDTEGLCANLHHEATGKWPAEGKDRGDHSLNDDVITAAGVLKPDGAWFADPVLHRPTPIQVDEDGRVFGHLATWKQCHMGVGNRCVMAPKSRTDYKFFKQGSVLTAGGKTVRVGKITIGTGHADKSFGVVPAIEHYDHTGSVVAVVNAGEDRFGVWVAGALVADVSEQRVAELRRSPLSGDWRRVDGNLELVAALAVNSPGFPVIDEDADGAYSLLAAGVLEPSEGADLQAQVHGLAEVDAYLVEVALADRVGAVEAAYHDLLPNDCGCAS